MVNKRTPRNSLKLFHCLTAGTAVVFSALVISSLAWNVHHERQEALGLARKEAVATFNKDLSFRLWGTRHGGVYVPVTEETPPNPYLAYVPERDVVTPSGRRLTLMNPAYMTRQMAQQFYEQYGVKAHITSLHPLNPGNDPDPWERSALQSFERGKREVAEVADLDGNPYLRLMRPLVVQEGCLKCHAAQGYRKGDIRGGIAVSVPMGPYLAIERSAFKTHGLSHALIWLLGMVGVGFTFIRGRREITERLEAEEQATAQGQLLEAFFENTLICVAILDRDFNFIRVNEAYARAGARRVEEFPGHNHFEFYPSEVKAIFEEVVATGKPYETVARPFVFPDHPEWGRTWWDWTLVPILDVKGEVERLIFTLNDVTGRKRAEEERLRNEERYRSLIIATAQMVWTTNTEGEVFEDLPSWRAFTGQSGDEIMGWGWSAALHPEDLRRTVAVWKNAVETHTLYDTEYRVRRHDGEYRNFSVRGVPVQDDDGTIREWVGTCTDVTERRRLEEQLRQAQKMEAIGHLAGGIAHDFNNILTAIMGFGSLLKMDMKEDDPLRVDVDQILAAADRAAKLTRSLLAFSRKQVMAARPTELNGIIRNVEKFLRRVIGEDVELRTSLAQESLNIFADIGQLEQVLMNLATNARDAMAGGGSLSIETATVEMDDAYIRAHGYGHAGSYALLTITDTGCGMDGKTLERVFEPFFTTKEVGKGTGLGLSVVYGIVKQHGGYINVYSEPGKGTAFKIYIPPTGAGDESAERAPVPPPRRGTETILLAEDDETIRKLVTRILSDNGYSVIAAQDGAEAVARFAEHESEIRFLLLDLIMPKKTGREVLEEARQRRPEMKALFMSGYTADIIQQRGLLEEGVDMVMKPVVPLELLRKVREVLDR